VKTGGVLGVLINVISEKGAAAVLVEAAERFEVDCCEN
jgi:hypothetical protein